MEEYGIETAQYWKREFLKMEAKYIGRYNHSIREFYRAERWKRAAFAAIAGWTVVVGLLVVGWVL
jgi:predicted Zn-dependent protease